MEQVEQEEKLSQEEVLADLKLKEPPLEDTELFYLKAEDQDAFNIRRERCCLQENEVARQKRIKEHPHDTLREQYELWVQHEYEKWSKDWPPKTKLPLTEVQTIRALLFGYRYYPNFNLWFYNSPVCKLLDNKEEAARDRARKIEYLRGNLYSCLAEAAEREEHAASTSSESRDSEWESE